MPSFADEVVLITGTARGCGAVLAEAFATSGATVVGCDLDAEAGEAVAGRIRASGGRIADRDEPEGPVLLPQARDQRQRARLRGDRHPPAASSGAPSSSRTRRRRPSSDEARFCTGTTLVLDGGFTAQ